MIKAGVWRALGLACVAMAMLSLVGGQWAILQAVAWGQMLRDYSQNASLGVAVVKTFGGQFPCALCKRVAAGRQQESRQAPLVKLEKKSVESLPDAACAVVRPRAGESRYFCLGRGAPDERFDPPPGPPPRA